MRQCGIYPDKYIQGKLVMILAGETCNKHTNHKNILDENNNKYS